MPGFDECGYGGDRMNRQNNQTNVKQTILWSLITAFFLMLICFNLFFRLDADGIADDDEAWHANNVYEMYTSRNYLVNTYYYETDYYNSKPPLSLWLMTGSLKLFGVSLKSLKFPSALSGLLAAVIVIVFIIRESGIRTAASFSGMYLLMDQLYRYHCFRTGNMDALFCLLCVICLLALYCSGRNFKWFMLYGFAAGLAFLTKGTHIAWLVLIGGVVLLHAVIRRSFRLRYFLCGIVLFAVPVGAWALLRYRFDGTRFFYSLLIGETGEKLSRHFSSVYLGRMATQPVYVTLFVLFAIYLLLCRRNLSNFIRKYYIFILWLLAPAVLYSMMGTAQEWYLYPSYIAATILGALITEDIWKCSKKSLSVIVSLALCLVCAGIGVRRLGAFTYDAGGSASKEMQQDFQELMSSEGNAFRGYKAYIQTGYDNSREERTWWKSGELAIARYYGQYECLGGGVWGFLASEDSILVLDKAYWDEYAPMLAGYVILEDNHSLIFCHSTY